MADAEAYPQAFHALERLGRFLNPRAKNLGAVRGVLFDLAKESPYAEQLPTKWPQFHRHFASLFETLRVMRNDVMHVGSRARHLTTFAVEACLILEDALENSLETVGDFMVADVITVEGWHPVSLARQRMLEHSFTFLPVAPASPSQQWGLLADHHLARFLGGTSGKLDRLAMPIADAIEQGKLETYDAEVIEADQPVARARELLRDRPLLVTSRARLIGIVTAFDLL